MTNTNTNTNHVQLEIQRNRDRALIPSRYRSASFSGIWIPTGFEGYASGIFDCCRNYAEQFQDVRKTGTSLMLVGGAGTGKTYVACAVANTVLSAGFTALYMTTMDVVRRVKATWRKDSDKTETQAFNSFIVPDLMVIDEIGVQFGSDAERVILFEILNSRYSYRLPTILISNLSQADISEAVTPRVMDRMRDDGGAVLRFTWGSFRGQQDMRNG